MNCYKLIITIIGSLDETGQDINMDIGFVNQDAKLQKKQLVQRALLSTDEYFHNVLYNWFITEGKAEELLEISTPYLETYLLQEDSDSSRCDLLWKYYARQDRMIDAAKVLYEIAHTARYISVDVSYSLPQRLETLVKAVTFAKGSSDFGRSQQILNEMTDTLDVARIQYEIYEALSFFSQMEMEKEALYNNLLDLQPLYNEYAEKHELDECKLSILFIADQGITGRRTAEQAWQNIIEKS